MEKGVFVKDIIPNNDLAGIFVVSAPALAQSRNGPYWRLTLCDASGNIEAKIWSPLSQEIDQIPDSCMARISGRASLYRDQLQLSISAFAVLDARDAASLSARDFMPSSSREPDEMFAELRTAALEEFCYRPWRKLILGILNDEETREKLRVFPAAKAVHHAYTGGLLEHTLGVFSLCRKFSDQYPQLDRQTLLAGAILHDIGKTREFSGGFANDYTDEGRLVGHMLLGLELIMPFLAKSGLEQQLENHLRHLVLSHHGQAQFGAPCLPQTAEAFALHYADNIDAKLAQCRGLFADDSASDVWSPWQATLERKVFRPSRTPESSPRAAKKPEEQCLSLLKE